MSDDLKSLLNAYTSAALTTMHAFHDLTLKGPRPKNKMVTELSKALAERDRIVQSWNDLSQAERALVEGLLQREGEASVRTLRESLARQGLIDKEAKVERYGPSKLNPRAENSRRFDDILARLTLRGLVFAATDPDTPYPNSPGYQPPLRDFDRPPTTVFIPDAIRRHLPQPPPAPAIISTPIRVVHQREASARIFQRDVYLYWSFIRQQPLTLTAKDEPHKSLLKEVSATLLTREELGKGEGELDHPRLRFVRLMLTALGLSTITADHVMEVKESADFFARAPADRVKQCFDAWRAGHFFNELVMLPRNQRPAKIGPLFLAADDVTLNARRMVLKQIENLWTGEWIAFETLLEQMRERHYEFLFRRPTPLPYNAYYAPHPYFAMNNRMGADFPNIRTDEDGWDKVEAPFIRGVVLGPLYWMGLADLGWPAKETETPAAFRLTPLGLWVLGLGSRPEIASEGGRVIVQPNLHIIALDPVNDATLVTLDHFAERLSAERAVEYRLTRASLYAGQQNGWDAARIKEFLKSQTGAELPGNVARTLDEWQAQHERIVLRPHVALAHGTANALDELMRDPQAQAFIAARPAPDVVRLTGPQTIPEAVRVIGQHGILPLVTERPTVTPNSVEVSETGRVRLLAHRPSLYLHGHLAALADPVGEDQYQISHASVARAARAGLTAPELLKRLELIQRGPVPEALARRLRAWAKHYGGAALDEVMLLQVRDPATLNELLADPDIATLLQPFTPAKTKALARVRPQDAEQLRARLAERGIELQSQLD